MSAVTLGTDIDQRPALVRFVMIDAAKGSRGPELQFWNGQIRAGSCFLRVLGAEIGPANAKIGGSPEALGMPSYNHPRPSF
jgi:hypothetical protein